MSIVSTTFLKAAEACFKAGVPFALGLGQTNDSINNSGSWYAAFGAQLIDDKGKISLTPVGEGYENVASDEGDAPRERRPRVHAPRRGRRRPRWCPRSA